MNSLSIKFESDPADVISRHLEAVYPNEGCGFFFGKQGKPRIVTEALIIKNVKKGDQRRRFEINPLDFVKAEKYALENSLDLLGVFHSHPNHPAIPSEHDRIQAMPYFSYLIVSVMEGKVEKTTSWRLNDENRQFEQENLIDQHNFSKSTANV